MTHFGDEREFGDERVIRTQKCGKMCVSQAEKKNQKKSKKKEKKVPNNLNNLNKMPKNKTSMNILI